MAAVGDLNQDKLTDVAIGAPLEGIGTDSTAGFGSVYIYNGRRDGLSASPSQVTLGLRHTPRWGDQRLAAAPSAHEGAEKSLRLGEVQL